MSINDKTKTIPKCIQYTEQQSLFSRDILLPEKQIFFINLKPSPNLSAIFEECHNYIYANEGMLKDRIFREMVKLLIAKFHDEKRAANNPLQFSITLQERQSLLTGNSNRFEQKINQLFSDIRPNYPAFSSDARINLKPLTLAYIVERLQYISLIQTPGDVKGEAFQTFVYRNQRGDRGEFFTPYPIVRLAIDLIAPTPDETIIDPACGSGGFLIQALAHIAEKYPELNKINYINQQICGIDFNPDVALSAMIRLQFEGGSGREIECANALLENKPGAFDLVLTNPPFGNKGKVEDPEILKSYLLAHRWQRKPNNDWEATRTLLPGQSPEILFIEKCLNLLRPGGRMASVLPDGILQNSSTRPVRFWIRSQAKVLGVISIPQQAFIPSGTGIKTSLLLLQKYPSPLSSVFMARIKKLGYDVKGQPIYQQDQRGRPLRTISGGYLIDDDLSEITTAYADFNQGIYTKFSDSIYTVDERLLNSRLDVEHYDPADLSLLAALRKVTAKPLGELATILNETAAFRLDPDREIRYIAIADVDARSAQVVAQQVLKAHQAPSRATYQLKTGDIITAISGASTGTVKQATALVTAEEDGAICSNGFAVLRDIHGVEPLFLLAYLRTDGYLRQIRRLMTGHAIPVISIDDLATVLVPVPNSVDQERIAKAMIRIQELRQEAIKMSERTIQDTQQLITEWVGFP